MSEKSCPFFIGHWLYKKDKTSRTVCTYNITPIKGQGNSRTTANKNKIWTDYSFLMKFTDLIERLE